MSADFLDSNLFIYLFDESDPRKQAVASQCVTKALHQGSGVISFQVVQESLNVLTRKLKVPLKLEDALSFFEQVLQPLWQVQPSAALYARALVLQTDLSISFYDSVMVSSALQAGCKRLLTEDLQHGQRIEGLRIENPFKP